MTHEWSDKYLIGISQIDAQHRRFFDAAQRLSDDILNCAGEEAVEGSLAFLRQYAEEHFAEEEAFMQQHQYPQVEAHKKLHVAFMARLQDLLEDYNVYNAPTQDMADQILEMTQGWLIDHIADEDRQYARYVSAE